MWGSFQEYQFHTYATPSNRHVRYLLKFNEKILVLIKVIILFMSFYWLGADIFNILK